MEQVKSKDSQAFIDEMKEFSAKLSAEDKELLKELAIRPSSGQGCVQQP